MAYYAEGDSPIVTTGGNQGGGSGFGYGNDAWVLIILFALIFGWGRNGNGGWGGGSNGGGIADNYVLATDFATLERKLDGVNAGICDSTFALNNTITNGFFGVQNALCQGFSGVNLGLTTQGYETRNAITDVGYALKDCCCQTQRAIDGVNFNLATQFGNLNTTLCGLGRDIIENQNANYRALHDELVSFRIEDKNTQIANQQNEINALRLKASQEAQNNYLLSQLKPCPVSAYVVQPPQQVTFPTNCCGNVAYAGYNNGCSGCGNF